MRHDFFLSVIALWILAGILTFLLLLACLYYCCWHVCCNRYGDKMTFSCLSGQKASGLRWLTLHVPCGSLYFLDKIFGLANVQDHRGANLKFHPVSRSHLHNASAVQILKIKVSNKMSGDCFAQPNKNVFQTKIKGWCNIFNGYFLQ